MTEGAKSVQQLVDAVVMAGDAGALNRDQRSALNAMLTRLWGKELAEAFAQFSAAIGPLFRKDE
jgi:hypothetical protein